MRVATLYRGVESFARKLGARKVGVASAAALLGAALAASPAAADSAVGGPTPWGLGLQQAAGIVKERISSLHDFMLVVITLVTLLVIVLLSYVLIRFHASRNPTPSRTSHNTMIEVIWTVIPVLILVAIAVPSFRLLYFTDRARDPDMTVQVTAFQWAWSYEYPDQDGLTFESYMVQTDQLQPGQPRLLTVDNELVIPAGKTIRVLVTSRDVIHSLFVPSLGIQKYAIPGRTLETWFRVDRPGVYHGQCNQICGVNHAFMPIVVRAVPEAEFTTWVAEAKRRFANDATRPAAVVADAAGGEAGVRLAAAGAPARQ